MKAVGSRAPAVLGGRAYRDRHRHLRLSRALLDERSNPLRHDERASLVRLRQEHAEPVAAEAGGDVVVAGRFLERVRYSAQRTVAGQVPVRRVDVPQMVDIDHEEGDPPVEAARAAQLLVERRAEVAQVVEAGLVFDPRSLEESRDGERAVGECETAGV
jgi:hypothetical protein